MAPYLHEIKDNNLNPRAPSYPEQPIECANAESYMHVGQIVVHTGSII